MVTPEIAAESRPRIPDLEIAIRLDGTGRFLFEVHAPDPDVGINSIPLHSNPLGMTPGRFFQSHFKDIENLSLKTEEERQAAEKKLGVKGLAVWNLFPRELQDLLWERRGQALTLLIQSDEPYIPWEIAKLQSRRNGKIVPGPFLCEAFAITRWVRGIPHKVRLPIESIALVVPRESKLPGAAREREEMVALAKLHGRMIKEIEPRCQPVCEALASGTHDGWHFAGHGAAIGDDADCWSIRLDGDIDFSVEDLRDETANLGDAKPLVFFNGCTTGRSGLTLTGPGGWSHGFLKANAGAFIGTYWAIKDGKAQEMAKEIYEGLFSGLPIGEAVRQARLRLHERYKGDPTWLAYTVFAHPLATCAASAGEPDLRERLAAQKPPLTASVLQWRPDRHPPGALLRAQYGIVPFHRRDKELGDLQDWCLDPSPVRVLLYTGPGGMGKTRLALEAALKMKKEGWWTGFVTSEALRSPEETWKALVRPEGKLLLILDYAETNRPFLIPVLREMCRIERGPLRLLLLARAALDWWEQLKSEPEGVGELLCGPATSRLSLAQLADSVEARTSSYEIAAQAFAERLALPLPGERPGDLDAKHFERVLLLHMNALIDVEGQEKAWGEDGILDRILAREKKFWTNRANDWRLSAEVVPGIGRALAAITLGGGVAGEKEALKALHSLHFFANQPAAVLTGVARLLHECYPGERWIEPIQPDLLGEHLVQRELEQGADELLDLVLGPRGGA